MADIFISYSSKDRDEAHQLADRLAAAGLSVWIDSSGIDFATSWSAEIVNAINDATAVIVLLSANSITSQNVSKEVSLASEKRKALLPVELEPVALSGAFEYHLAGIQRTAITNPTAIFRGLSKAGLHVPPELLGEESSTRATPATAKARTAAAGLRTNSHYKAKWYVVGLVILLAAAAAYVWLSPGSTQTMNAPIKALAVLPFDNLSPDRENDFFADGMTATLIDILSPLQGLKVADRRSVMEFKGVKQNLKSIASTLDVRYIVEGTVQKQGSAIRISLHMTDVSIDSVVLSKVFDGTTADLIKLQEEIGRKVAVFLEVALNPEGIVIPPEMKTSVPEAYNLCLLGGSSELNSEESIEESIRYFATASKLDPGFAFPLMNLARLYGNLYLTSHKASDLAKADSFLVVARKLDSPGVFQHFIAGFLSIVHGNCDVAISEATAYIQKRPNDVRGYRILALAYERSGRREQAIANWEEVVKRSPLEINDIGNLIVVLYHTKDTVRLRKYLPQALSVYELAIARHPDATDLLAFRLFLLGQDQRYSEAIAGAKEFIAPPNNTPVRLALVAAIFAECHQADLAMTTINECIQKLGKIPAKNFVDFSDMDFDNLRKLPAFQTLAMKQEEASKADHGH